MAHADYHCCAICDSKMDFSYNAESKERICSRCVKNLCEQGIFIDNTKDLKEWMEKEEPKKVAEILDRIGFEMCCWPNSVDDAYMKMKMNVADRSE